MTPLCLTSLFIGGARNFDSGEGGGGTKHKSTELFTRKKIIHKIEADWGGARPPRGSPWLRQCRCCEVVFYEYFCVLTLFFAEALAPWFLIPLSFLCCYNYLLTRKLILLQILVVQHKTYLIFLFPANSASCCSLTAFSVKYEA